MSMIRGTAQRNDTGRVEEAAQSIEDAAQSIHNAMLALTRSVCLLGFSEGKEAVQRAAQVVAETQRIIRKQNGIEMGR